MSGAGNAEVPKRPSSTAAPRGVQAPGTGVEGDARLARLFEPQLVRRPLVILAVAFCVGALLPADRPVLEVSVAVAFALGAAALAWQRHVVAALALPLVFLLAGLAASALRLPPAETASAVVDLDGKDAAVLEGVIAEAPEVSPRSTRLLLDLVATATVPAGPMAPVRGRVSLFVVPAEGGPPVECGEAGDRVRVFARLRPIEDRTFPGGLPRRALAARRGVALLGHARGADRCVVLGPAEGFAPGRAMERVRGALHQAIDRALPGSSAGVVRAFATGDRAAIDRATSDAFADAGLSHLLAVSGLNLAIVAGLSLVALGWLLRRSERVALGPGVARTSALVAAPFVVLYTLLVGASPSAVRAAVMVLALLGAQATHRSDEAWSSLALAVIVMVAWDPTTLGDVSFQLSFAAVAALLRIYPALRARVGQRLEQRPRLVRLGAEVALASLAATIGTAPLVARHFGRLSLIGIVANVPAAPLSSLVLVPLSLVGGLLGLFSEALAAPVLTLAGWAAEALVAMARFFASLPLAAVRLPSPTILECLLFYGATIGFSLLPRRRWARRMAWGSLLALLVSFGGAWASRQLSRELEVTFLPVGQGDAVLVDLPGGTTMLVDTGPPGEEVDAAERVILPFLRHERIVSLDYVVLTHPHADHTGGLRALAEAVPIGEVWWTGDRRDVEEALLAPLSKLRARVVGAGVPALQVGDATVEVLGPVRPASSWPVVNDGSVVLSVGLGARRILLGGDAERAAEASLIESAGHRLRSDVLKLGHHGSATSSTEPFLEAVGAATAVITVGRGNVYGLPHREVLRRVEGRGMAVFRTDEDGAVTVRTDGEALSVTPFVVRADR
jgi:competence protein ComEC